METFLTKNIKKKDLLYLAKLVQQGKIIAFPTETVYGLGVDINQSNAIERLYKVKKRDKNKVFTLHISNISAIENFISFFPKAFFLLSKHFIPGPITIILPKSKLAGSYISSNGGIAIRMPAHDVCLELISLCGNVIAATSANISNKLPLYLVDEIIMQFQGEVDAILYDEKKGSKQASTVISLLDKKAIILREGEISKEKIENVLEEEVLLQKPHLK